MSPNHISTYVSSSNEKQGYDEKIVPKPEFEEDDDEDEDIDALIEELESQDGGNADYEDEEAQQPGGARLIPEELLQTDTRIGLVSGEVLLRRKKFGLNQMKGTLNPASLESLGINASQRRKRICS